jgi:hypothetical protein
MKSDIEMHCTIQLTSFLYFLKATNFSISSFFNSFILTEGMTAKPVAHHGNGSGCNLLVISASYQWHHCLGDDRHRTSMCMASLISNLPHQLAHFLKQVI